MTTRTTRAIRITAGGAAATLVMGVMSLVGVANAATGPSSPDQRIGGSDRYETAAQIAEKLGTDRKVRAFVVASGDPGSGGADALSANYLAGALAARGGTPVPVLLTRQNQLPQADVDTITRLTSGGPVTAGPIEIYVVGGPTAVSDQVVTELSRVGGSNVQRISGADRYATAAAAATELGAPAVGDYAPNPTDGVGATAFLSNGLSPADALSAGPIAYRSHFPLLQTKQGSIPQTTADAMKTDKVRNVILLGGTTAVSDAVVTGLQALGYTTFRVAGADRYATNTALYTFAHTAVGGTADNPRGGLGYPAPTTPLLAEGLGFADALAAGPLAAEGSPAPTAGGQAIAANSPLLLTSPKALSPSTATYLSENHQSIASVTGVGLDMALPPAVLAAANAAAQQAPTVVTPPAGSAVPAGFVAYNASFLDARQGFSLGNVPCPASGGFCATLARTMDGGATWRSMPVPAGLTGVDDEGNAEFGGSCGNNGTVYGPCVDKVQFADSLHGYLWSFRDFYSTNDGGATWTDGHTGALSVLSAHGSVYRLSPGPRCPGCTDSLSVAAVGSSTWQVTQPGGHPVARGASGLLAAGDDVFIYSQSTPTSPEVFYRSVNGGQSWGSTSSQPCGANGYGYPVGAPDGSLTLTCDYGGLQPATPVQVSTDGGATFHPVGSVPPEGTISIEPVSASTLLAINGPDTAGKPLTIFRSENDSAWSRVVLGSPNLHGVSGAFVNPSFGYVTDGRGALLLSTDGGKTFATVTVR